MEKKQQPKQDADAGIDYQFTNLYCHPDFLSGNGDATVEQVFGSVAKVEDVNKDKRSKPATMHARTKRKT